MGTEDKVSEATVQVGIVDATEAQVGVTGNARLERGEKVVQPAPVIEAPPAPGPALPENRFIVIQFTNGEQWQYPVAELAVKYGKNYGTEKEDLAAIRDDFERLEYPELQLHMTLFRRSPEPDKERQWYDRQYVFVAKSSLVVRTPDPIVPSVVDSSLTS